MGNDISKEKSRCNEKKLENICKACPAHHLLYLIQRSCSMDLLLLSLTMRLYLPNRTSVEKHSPFNAFALVTRRTIDVRPPCPYPKIIL